MELQQLEVLQVVALQLKLMAKLRLAQLDLLVLLELERFLLLRLLELELGLVQLLEVGL